MNDRFKFRVLDKRKNTYLKDFVFNFINKAPYITVEYFDNEYEYTHTFEEDEIIIEQCIGLNDKNDKLIYEGDIVIKDKQQFEVYYDDSLFGYYLRSNNIVTVFASNTELEVIGNIHENADLLGE